MNTSTQRFITLLARRTSHVAAHGQVEQVQRGTANVVDKGYYLQVDTFAVVFADGVQRTYWLRGGVPVVVR